MQNASDGVIAATNRLRELMLNPDRAQLNALLMDELDYGHTSSRMDTKTSLVDVLADGITKYLTIDITDQSVKVVGDVGIVRHNFHARNVTRGTPNEVRCSILLVWVLRDGVWKLIARQAVRLP